MGHTRKRGSLNMSMHDDVTFVRMSVHAYVRTFKGQFTNSEAVTQTEPASCRMTGVSIAVVAFGTTFSNVTVLDRHSPYSEYTMGLAQGKSIST